MVDMRMLRKLGRLLSNIVRRITRKGRRNHKPAHPKPQNKGNRQDNANNAQPSNKTSQPHGTYASAVNSSAGANSVQAAVFTPIVVVAPSGALLTPSIEETNSLSAACDKLWSLDDNRLTLGRDVVVHLAGRKRSIHDTVDRCEEPFFTRVDPAVWKRPTYKTFKALLDNYSAVCGVAEVITPEARREEGAFIEAVYKTRPMLYCHKYLEAKGKVSSNPNDFKKMLHSLWFGQYRRTSGGPLDSSGFEHVFVGEVKDGEVSGCHNWIKIYEEEVAGNLNYKGYFAGRARNGKVPPANPYVATIQFDWLGVTKKVGSSLVAVSPEFEMALYTMCFLTGGQRNLVEIGDYSVTIVCHQYNGGRNVGTCYCEV